MKLPFVILNTLTGELLIDNKSKDGNQPDKIIDDVLNIHFINLGDYAPDCLNREIEI